MLGNAPVERACLLSSSKARQTLAWQQGQPDRLQPQRRNQQGRGQHWQRQGLQVRLTRLRMPLLQLLLQGMARLGQLRTRQGKDRAPATAGNVAATSRSAPLPHHAVARWLWRQRHRGMQLRT